MQEGEEDTGTNSYWSSLLFLRELRVFALNEMIEKIGSRNHDLTDYQIHRNPGR